MVRLSGSGILVLCLVANAGLSTRSEVPANDLALQIDDNSSAKVLANNGETTQESTLNEESMEIEQDDRVYSFSPNDPTTVGRRVYVVGQQVEVYFRSDSGFGTLHYVYIPNGPTDVYTLVETYLKNHKMEPSFDPEEISMVLRSKDSHKRERALSKGQMSGAEFLEQGLQRWNLVVTKEPWG